MIWIFNITIAVVLGLCLSWNAYQVCIVILLLIIADRIEFVQYEIKKQTVTILETQDL